MNRIPTMQQVLDDMAEALFGMSNTEAVATGTCLRCKRVFTSDDRAAWMEIDRREFAVSATCPTCWIELFPPEDRP